MAHEIKNNSGMMYEKPKQKIGKKSGMPYENYSGRACVGGVHYWLNATLKQLPNGQCFRDIDFRELTKEEIDKGQ